MKETATKNNPYIQLIYRPFWGAALTLLIILTLALAVLINTSWRAVHRIEPLKLHLALVEELRRYNAELEALAPAVETPQTDQSQNQLLLLQDTLVSMQKRYSTAMSDEASTALANTIDALRSIQTKEHQSLSGIQQNLRTALEAETNVQRTLLHLLARDNRLELETATSIAITLPLLGLLLLFFMRHRILRPLNNLGLLINQLGPQTLPPVPLHEVEPLLKPLFIDFNCLLLRLRELEQAQQSHQQELENRVRQATQSLLESHHALAQSERLAAVGELTARLAHELRNPLAGIQLALTNLRNESDNPEVGDRLTLVLNEMTRMTVLLNEVLDQSRHAPEAASDFDLADTVASLLQLVRYQIPPSVTLEQQIAMGIQCHLPQGRLHQTLLNLILNAAHSIGENKGRICISAQRQHQTITILVHDNGPGFPAQFLSEGVQPFVSHRKTGTGLGLSIARRFCNDQGGSLSLSNADDGGACVKLTLPGGR